ncbi:MAG: pilus assembly protein [Chloroflexi bacterium]|nr:pilus assembly protein [Chloroflexota bacterium]
MPVQAANRWSQEHRGRTGGQRGQALVEVALVVPVLLLLAFGVIGVGRIVQAQMGVSAVAREAARAAALANDPEEASVRGIGRGDEVASGYRLTNGSLQLNVDPGSFARGTAVRAMARYEVRLEDLPLLGWVRFPVASDHVERTDLYRSRWTAGGNP